MPPFHPPPAGSPDEAPRSESDSGDRILEAEFRKRLPHALHGAVHLINLCIAVFHRRRCDGLTATIDTVYELHVRQPIQEEARRLIRRCRGPLTWITLDDLTNEAMALLLSSDVPSFDPVLNRLPSSYWSLVVRRAFDRLRSGCTTRPVVKERNWEDPAGPPVSRRVRRDRFLQIPADFDVPACPADAADLDPRVEALQGVLQRVELSDPERAIIVRHYYEGVGLKELARELGVTDAALYQCHARLKVKLRLEMASIE